MGPLSELWVMIENINIANDDNVPAVQIDMVLEMFEKTVVPVSNVLLDITGTSTSITQVPALLKKASFL